MKSPMFVSWMRSKDRKNLLKFYLTASEFHFQNYKFISAQKNLGIKIQSKRKKDKLINKSQKTIYHDFYLSNVLPTGRS